jgi:hypothetical protein
MGNILKVIVTGARWMWKNSWWILPAGEEIFDAVKRKFRKKANDELTVKNENNK